MGLGRGPPPGSPARVPERMKKLWHGPWDRAPTTAGLDLTKRVPQRIKKLWHGFGDRAPATAGRGPDQLGPSAGEEVVAWALG